MSLRMQQRSPIAIHGSWSNLAALYEKPEDKEIHEAWISKYKADLRQSDDGAYVNFLADVDEAQVRAAYPNGAWERLAAIKARYDPDNFFHLNQNISAKVIKENSSLNPISS